MGLDVARGFLNTTTNAAGNTVVVSGLGFQPKVVFFWWNGRTNTTDSVGRANHQTGFGYAVSTTDRRYATCLAQDTPTAMVTNRMQGNAACIGITTTADAIDGLMDLQSMDSGGFTLVIDDAFAASYTIHYMALGGSDIVNVGGNNFTMATVTGNQDVEQVSFLPNFILFFSNGQQTINDSVSVDAGLVIGAAKSSSNRYVVTGGSNDAASNAQTVSYAYDGECIAFLNSAVTLTESRADFVNFHSSPANGFRINWLENAASTKIISYLAIQFTNANYAVLGDLLTQTDTSTDIVESGFPFKPLGAMFLSHCKAKSTQDTVQDDHELSIGAFHSTSSRSAMGMMDDDAAATAVVGTAVEFDEIYVNLPSTAATVEGLMDIKSIENTGFTTIMDDADPAQAFVWYMAFGLEHQTVNLTFIASTSTVNALTVKSTITLGHIASTSQVFSPTVQLASPQINLSFIASTSQLFSPTLKNTIALSHIASASSLFNPTLESTITLSTITSTSSLFNPTLQSKIALSHVASASTLFSPTLQSKILLTHIASTSLLFSPSVSAQGGNQQLNLTFIASTSSVFAPTLKSTIALTFQSSTSQLFNPTLQSRVLLGHVASSSTSFNPTLKSTIVLSHITSTSTLFSPTFRYTILLGAIASTSTLYSPTLQITGSISLGFIASTSQLFSPTLKSTVLLGHVASASTVFALTLKSGILLGFIASTGIVYPLTVGEIIVDSDDVYVTGVTEWVYVASAIEWVYIATKRNRVYDGED